MNFLIFGGEGFIGRNLATHIKKNNPTARIYSLDIKPQVNPDSANYIYTDVRQPIALDIPNLSSSVIFNLAAIHTTPGHPDNEYFETNMPGAENICNFARENNIQAIVFTSSIAPYGASEETKRETTVPQPNTPYGISKLVAEHIHKTWQAEKATERKLIIVRPGVVFGRFEGGNFTRLYNSLKKGFFFYPGRKDTLKAAVYVKDVVRILYETAVNEKPGVALFNLTYFPAPTIEKICQIIARVTNVKPPKLLVPATILKMSSGGIYYAGRAVGKKFNGIHPARVKKLMVSTNIIGEKLQNSPYALQFSLEDAIRDWYEECDKKELS